MPSVLLTPASQVLQQVHDKLNRSLRPTTSIDPFQILPAELLDMIFLQLPFHTMCRCLRVSRRWHAFLSSYAAWWQFIDLSQAKRPVSFKALNKYMQYSDFKIQRVLLKNIELQNSTILEQLLTRCKNIQNLTIASGGLISKSLMSAFRSPQGSLSHISLRGNTSISGKALHQIMISCKNLQNFEAHMRDAPSLHLHSPYHLETLMTLNLTIGQEMKTDVSNMSGLESRCAPQLLIVLL